MGKASDGAAGWWVRVAGAVFPAAGPVGEGNWGGWGPDGIGPAAASLAAGEPCPKGRKLSSLQKFSSPFHFPHPNTLKSRSNALRSTLPQTSLSLLLPSGTNLHSLLSFSFGRGSSFASFKMSSDGKVLGMPVSCFPVLFRVDRGPRPSSLRRRWGLGITAIHQLHPARTLKSPWRLEGVIRGSAARPRRDWFEPRRRRRPAMDSHDANCNFSAALHGGLPEYVTPRHLPATIARALYMPLLFNSARQDKH